MWYFAWILGTLFAVSFGILNALWYEAKSGDNVERTCRNHCGSGNHS